jgi:hypothetical protein
LYVCTAYLAAQFTPKKSQEFSFNDIWKTRPTYGLFYFFSRKFRKPHNCAEPSSYRENDTEPAYKPAAESAKNVGSSNKNPFFIKTSSHKRSHNSKAADRKNFDNVSGKRDGLYARSFELRYFDQYTDAGGDQ